MRASDHNYYVVKFQNNPQHAKVLANEMFATSLGLWLGLPMPQSEVIEVSGWLIEHTPELRVELAGHVTPCLAGPQLGSRYPCDPMEGQVFDYLPENMFDRVKNVADFARVLVLDKWTGNCDGRQAVFSKSAAQRKFRATFIDQGYCFNAGEWSFPDLALHGVYYRNFPYRSVNGWDAFEPALTKAEEAELLDLWRCAERVPPEWFDNDYQALQRLVEALYERRSKIRDLIAAFHDSVRNPFPNWGESSCNTFVSSSDEWSLELV